MIEDWTLFLAVARHVGELIQAQKESAGLAKGGRPTITGSKPDPVSEPATLAEAGIDKHLADRSRKLAALPEEKFEGMMNDWRGRVESETERASKGGEAGGIGRPKIGDL